MSSNRNSIHKLSFEGSSGASDDGSGVTLLHEHIKGSLNPPTRRERLRNRFVKLLVFAVSLISVTSLIYTAIGVHRLSSAATTDYGDCGSTETVEEARAKGCVFDPMSWIWVRPECYDAELVAEFMAQTNFSWHTEPKLKPETKLDMEIIYRGDHPKLFTQKDYHTVHCFVSLPRDVPSG